MSIPILFEDDYLIAIDKPSGIVVNKSETAGDTTVQEWAENKLGIKNYELRIKNDDTAFYDRAGIVHRLDKETSGVLIIAKDPDSFIVLQQQFAQRTIQKKYIALVHGNVIGFRATIKAAVGRLPWNRTKFGVLPDGREAETSYTVQSHFKGNGNSYTLLSVIPHTGRTHQIRIHVKHAGYSVVSDPLYAGRNVYRQDILFCPRLFLHAAGISFVHPKEGKEQTVKSPLPQDLVSALKKLEEQKV